MNKLTCKSCGKNFNTLTNEEICYYCFVDKFKTTPKTGVYKEGKK